MAFPIRYVVPPQADSVHPVAVIELVGLSHVAATYSNTIPIDTWEICLAANRCHVRNDGPAIDSAREAAARPVASDAVLDSQRAAADGRDRLQRTVPLVRGNEYGRRGLGCHHLHQEPRPPVGRRRGSRVSDACSPPSSGKGPGFGRALHRRWNTD